MNRTLTLLTTLLMAPFALLNAAHQPKFSVNTEAGTYSFETEAITLKDIRLEVGNPALSDAAAVLPTFDLSQDGDWLYYVHKQRVHDSSLVYTVQTSTDLTGTSWTTVGTEKVGESAVVNNFKTVTTRTAVGNRAFTRLKIEYN